MNALAECRAFLAAYRKAGTLAGAIEATGAADRHAEWMRDPDYSRAFAAVTREIKHPPKPKAPKPRKPRRLAAPKPAPDPEPEPAPPATEPPQPKPAPEPPPAAESVVYPSKHGHTRLYVREGQEIEPPEPEPERPPRPVQPEPEPTLEVTVASDAEMKSMLDEFGELSRKMQLYAPVTARFELLKKTIKNWFNNAPDDADGVVEGTIYRIHVSARERERRVRDMRELLDRIGIDNLLRIATVSIGALQTVLPNVEIESLLIEKRSGSRRIKCIPMFPATPPRLPDQA